METTDTLESCRLALAAGLAQHRCGNLEGAAAHYRRALVGVPGHPHVLNLLGVIEYQLGRYSAARALAERAIAGDPAEGRFYLNLANISRAEGRRDEAEATLRSGLAAAPGGRFELALNLGVALTEAGRHAEAIEALQEAVKLRED